ncbi:GLPGLI family protein [Nonlabens xylanidelens]|uniref:GLPGLI family protein n=1 Tax=Nonlabens xylanidelens TaxID=191564 RepID=A0A2S6IRT7_9FLAO|nr:GLPGLI family protein [Nonlabens xylanidelens]PPK96746.1 GLPGLI family protein [Nonlabens xylanidelens]
MKSFNLSMLFFVVLAFAKAYTVQAQQDFTGIAHYQSKMTMKQSEDSTQMAKLEPAMREMIEEAMKKAGEAEFTLKFNRTESLYEKVKKLAAPKKPVNGMSMTIEMSGNGDTYGTTYKDLTAQTFLREDNIQGKEFLVTDKIEKLDWKVTGETKMIGKYTAMKATYTFPKEEKEESEEESTSLLNMVDDKEHVVTAWFTMDIPISNGPGIYQGLPGLILELNEGEITILCNKIEMNPEDFEIKKPRKGKEISTEKFNKLRDKKAKEMRERFKSGSGGVFIETH